MESDQKTLTSDSVEELRKLVNEKKEKKLRVLQKMQTSHSDKLGVCFAIQGLKLSSPEETLEYSDAKIRRIEEPADFTELAVVLSNYCDYSRIGHYLYHCDYELFFPLKKEDYENENLILLLAKHLFSLMRIRCGIDFIVPMVANRSWSVISACPPKSVNVIMLEDYPDAIRFSDNNIVELSDFKWVIDYLDKYLRLVRNKRMGVAVDALSSLYRQKNDRMAIACMWAGIEAILDIQSELRFRISSEIAAFLEQRGNERLRVYKDIKKQYDFRSKAVHGAAIDESIIRENVAKVRDILRTVLTKCIELDHIPTSSEFEDGIHL